MLFKYLLLLINVLIEAEWVWKLLQQITNSKTSPAPERIQVPYVLSKDGSFGDVGCDFIYIPIHYHSSKQLRRDKKRQRNTYCLSVCFDPS